MSTLQPEFCKLNDWPSFVAINFHTNWANEDYAQMSTIRTRLDSRRGEDTPSCLSEF